MMKKILLTVLCAALAGCTGLKKDEEAAETASPEPVSYACRTMDYYDYMTPVPPSDAIEESYYSDALFAGDSRMGSLYLYGTHDNALVEYVTSLNLLLIDTMPADNHDDQITLYDILSTTDKSNIYLLFGINGIRNRSFDPFAEKLQEILTMLRENNPDSDIYIILAYHPDKISGLDEPKLTEQLQDLNGHLITLAQNNYMYYLDTDNGLDDDQGTIRDEYVWDGLHFNPTGAHAFEDYIATHVVRREKYVKEICE